MFALAWLISLNIVISPVLFIFLQMTVFLFMAQSHPTVCKHYIFLICASVDGRVGRSHFLAPVNMDTQDSEPS